MTDLIINRTALIKAGLIINATDKSINVTDLIMNVTDLIINRNGLIVTFVFVFLL